VGAGLSPLRARAEAGGRTIVSGASRVCARIAESGGTRSLIVRPSRVHELEFHLDLRPHVIGTGRASAKATALEMGADSFVDLEQPRWEEAIGQARRRARDGYGRPDIWFVHFIPEPNRRQLRQLAELVDSGKVQPQVSAEYPLADAVLNVTASGIRLCAIHPPPGMLPVG
jgi:zinc-binding alcohol dehydrogenase family protein